MHMIHDAPSQTDEVNSSTKILKTTKKVKLPKSHYTAPACGFQIAKIFQLGFFTNDSARPRHNWGFTASRELKRVKRISAFFSLALLQNRNHLN